MAIDEGLNVMWQVAAEISADGRRSIAVLEDAGVVLGGPVAAEPKVRLREAGGGRDSWGHRSMQKTTV